MRKISSFLFIVLLFTAVSGQPGLPDPTFGNNGFISKEPITTGNTSSQRIVETIVETGGKIFLIIQENGKTVIGKRFSNGQPDAGYGKNGFSVIVSLISTAAAIQPDGKIVVAGSTNGYSDFMLARYNADGGLDASFGNAGTVISDITPSADFLSAVAITTTGRIITAGNTNNHFTLVGFTEGGARDNSFGNNSIVETDFNGQASSVGSICLQPDGKIVAAGSVISATNGDFALARYNEDGSPDLSFNGIGKTSSDFGASDRAFSVTLGNDGKIYAGGNSSDFSGFQHFRIARYNTDGTPDKTYNNGAGSVLASFGDSYDVLIKIRLQVDGTIVASGYSNINPISNDIALAHINYDGTVDKNFGNNGLLLADVNSQYDECGFLVIQLDGKILTGGSSVTFWPKYSTWFSCFRFDAKGIPDPGFGTNGILVDFIPGGDYSYSSLFVQPGGKLMAAGRSNDGNSLKMFINRFNENGIPDDTYGQNGSIDLAFQDGNFIFQPDGKLLSISYSQSNNGDFMLTRYNADGSADKGFGNGGIVTSDFGGMESPSQAAFQPDGKILVGGLSRDNNGSDWLIVRYNYDGSIDGSFGTNGYVRKNITTDENLDALFIGPDGKITVGGTGFSYPPDFNYFKMNTLVARFNPDGSADKGFGNNGLVILERGNNNSMGTLVVQNDFKIVFTYYLQDQFAPQQLYLERLNANGTDDLQFGVNGRIIPDGNRIHLQPDQKFLVTGSILNNRNNMDYSLSRFSKDGQPDLSFGTNGKTVVSFTGVDNNLPYGLLAGNAFYASGGGLDQWGQIVGLVAKFQLESLDMVSCPGNKEVPTDHNACSAIVNDIDPKEGCKPGSTITYTLTGATTGSGGCTASGALFNKGVTTVTYSTKDGTSSCSFTVTVNDNELPVIENLSTSITSIWPPDHKMKDITVNYNPHDNCGIAGSQITVSCNEPITSNDWQVIDDHHIRLRAERQEGGNGRIYTVTVTTTDISGNQNSKAVAVTVPKNQVPALNLNVSVRPNPSHNYFAVSINSDHTNKTGDNISVKIFNSIGVLAETYNNVNANSVLNVGDKLLPGIYWLEASQDGVTKTIKLVKQ